MKDGFAFSRNRGEEDHSVNLWEIKTGTSVTIVEIGRGGSVRVWVEWTKKHQLSRSLLINQPVPNRYHLPPESLHGAVQWDYRHHLHTVPILKEHRGQVGKTGKEIQPLFLKPQKPVSEISYQETINNEQGFYPRVDRKVVIGKVCSTSHYLAKSME